MDDRIHFIEHQRHQILLLDVSHTTAPKILLLVEYVRITATLHGRDSFLACRPLIRNTTWRGDRHRRSASGAGCASVPRTAVPWCGDPAPQILRKRTSATGDRRESRGTGSRWRLRRCDSDCA